MSGTILELFSKFQETLPNVPDVDPGLFQKFQESTGHVHKVPGTVHSVVDLKFQDTLAF